MTDVKQLPEAFLKEMEQLLGDEYEAYIKISYQLPRTLHVHRHFQKDHARGI